MVTPPQSRAKAESPVLAELEAAKAAARSKAAKKNAQRKAKKAAGPASPAPAQAGEVDISNGMASVR